MDGNPSCSFRVQADADIPTIAIRKALAYAGTITKCLPTASHAYILHFETEVALTSLVRMQSINNVNIKITKFDSFGSRGTIYHPEFSTWSLDEIQKEIGEGKVLRKLATKDRPAPVSGRVLLGFESPSLPTEVCVNILGEQLTVKQYIPGPLKCMECHVYGHHEKNCRNGPRCGNCGLKDHNALECRNNPPVCKACNRRHPVNDRNCKQWSDERKINTIRYSQNLSAQDARKIVSEQQVAKPPTFANDNFPAIRPAKRAPLSPPSLESPAPKRRQQWVSKPNPTFLTPAQPDSFNERLLSLLESQGKVLETIVAQNALILQVLQNQLRGTTLEVATPSTVPDNGTTPTSGLPPIVVSSPAPSVDNDTASDVNAIRPIVRSRSTPVVYNYGRDPGSPSASNVGTFDYKERN